LGSSRGGFDADKIISALVEKGINHVYVIGGDGTHRGIAALAEELKKRKL
jgi:6-phosphofructokinase 1